MRHWLIPLVSLVACAAPPSLGPSEARWFRGPFPPPPAWYEPEFPDAGWERGHQLPSEQGALYTRLRVDLGASAPQLTDVALVFPDKTALPEAYLNGVRLRPTAGEAKGERFGFRLPAGTLRDTDNVLALRFAAGQAPVVPSVEPLSLPGNPLLFMRGPYLLAPTEESITVAIGTSRWSSCTLSVEQRTSRSTEASSHRLEIAGLSPGARYTYEVVCTAEQESIRARGVATTAPAVGAPARLALFGYSGDSLSTLAPRAAALSPDAAIWLDGALPQPLDRASWEQFFLAGYGLLRDAAAIPLVPTHEVMFSPTPEAEQGPGNARSFSYGAAQLLFMEASQLNDKEARRWLSARTTAAKAQGQHPVVVLSGFNTNFEFAAFIDANLRGIGQELVVATGKDLSLQGRSKAGMEYLILGRKQPGFAWLEATESTLSTWFYPAGGDVRGR